MKNILVILGGLLLPLCANANRVAILDQGFNPNFPNTSVIGRQSCFSNRTIILQDAGTAQVEFLTASLCRNGLQFDQSPVSATVPRPYFYQPVESFPLGKELRHGNDVSSAGWNYAPDPDIQHHMIQVFGIGRSKSTDRDSTTAGGGDNIARALNHLANTDFSGLTAVSISVVTRDRLTANGPIVTPDLCRLGTGQTAVNTLLARNIPVIVALDNDNIPAFTSTWPACLKNVITVGGRNAGRPGGSPGLGIGTHNINFFADDTVSTNPARIGSSLATPRVAKAFALLSKEYPNATVRHKYEALFVSANRTRTITRLGNTFVRPIVELADLQKALNYLAGTERVNVRPEPTPILSDAVFIGEAYGDERTSYVTNFDYSSLLPESLTAPSLSANIIKSGSASNTIGGAHNSVLAKSRRDVYLQVTGIMPSTFNHFEVNVNRGSHFERIDGFSQLESTHSVVIHKRHFTENFENNVIIFPPGVSVGWGIRAVQFSLTPAIELTVGQTDTREYGYSDTVIPRLSGLRANFMLDSIENDVTISMTGWDIDRADETAVFVNGNFVGNLSQGGNSTYSAQDSFSVSSSLLRTGFNELELVQRDIGGGWSGIEDEKWAVKEIRVETALPGPFVNLVPIIMFLFDSEP